ncbi:HD-GYP domain-containing protein [Brevibacillus fluminis]|uniref:HD-GYP domain-containing protein n=1 Tax=Brevibacillus fluminis TaxID=511487 RepID=A0A3M8D5N8_9BACL|nr:HD-GYP domain-containing protein [Brevibacillus fluminis]RNB83394.1 HD-GYP domain-containing protein [Brevibacillus fluminis]
MRLISLDQCQAGIKLGRPIYNENGVVLLAEGVELTDKLIDKLKQYNVSIIYIEDEASEGIEIVDAVPEELRMEAINTIKVGLSDIAQLSVAHTNIQSMMKSGRAIRSFQKIFRGIISSLTENRMAINLLATTKIQESYVYTHSLNVAIYSCQLALENGLPLKDIEEIGLGAMLHDLGKLYVSRDILQKPGKLTDEEFEQVKLHCQLGFDTIRKVHEIPLPVAHCALQHHERIDGTGYPRGLTGDEIHRYAKIISVIDVFDAVTNPRPYRSAELPHKGLELLYAGSGTQFDSRQVDMFKKCIAIYPPGLTVKLNDGRVGIVSEYNFHAVGRPQIRIIQDAEQQRVQPYEIDLTAQENLTLEIVEAAALLPS